jgi:hypothetical protein
LSHNIGIKSNGIIVTLNETPFQTAQKDKMQINCCLPYNSIKKDAVLLILFEDR